MIQGIVKCGGPSHLGKYDEGVCHTRLIL